MPDSTINYRVRPRKNVERKIIAELLRDVLNRLPAREFRYIGFGSYWFEDFLLFHKALGLRSMYSIEYPNNAARARFNRPLRCIHVLEGESTHVLPTIEWGNNPSIVWLDYTADLGGPVFRDCDLLTQNLDPGSILLVTLNAHRQQLQNNSESDSPDRDEQLATLTRLVGNSLPAETSVADLSLKRFPNVVASSVLNHIQHAMVSSGRGLEFHRLVNVRYSDNAPMVTVGGIILDEETHHAVTDHDLTEKWGFLRERTPFEIEIPELTMREKLALDRLIPSGELSLKDEMERELGFSLKDAAVRSYERLYQYYPTFSEMQM